MKPVTKPTVADVAAAADVSVGTVSRVLNNREDVSPEIRERVREAAQKLGYQRLRSRAKRRKAQGRPAPQTMSIGLVLLGMDNSLSHLPVVVDALHGVQDALAGEGASLMLAEVPGLDRVPPLLAGGQVQGLILKSALDAALPPAAENPLMAALTRRPTVWLLGKPGGAEGDVCKGDNAAAGQLAFEHLVARSHRRLGTLNPKRTHTMFAERVEAFAARAARAGLKVNRFECEAEVSDSWPRRAVTHVEDVAGLVADLHAMPEAKRPTALFVPADSVAVQVYTALRQAGLQPGRDLSVISCNNERALLAGLEPALTTIDIHAGAIGRRAVAQLMWRIQHPVDKFQTTVVVEPEVVEGASVLAPRG